MSGREDTKHQAGDDETSKPSLLQVLDKEEVNSENKRMETIIFENGYDVKIMSTLEEHVDKQVKTGNYDFASNLHLLKLYLFHPDSIKITTVEKILAKSLMNLPQTHFLCCTYLLPEKIQEEDTVKSLVKLASLLETAQFRKFWNESQPLRSFFDQIHRFDESIRAFISSVLLSTYQLHPTSLLKEVLNLKGDAFNEYVKARGWTFDDNCVAFPIGEENLIPTKAPTEHITIEQMAKIISHFSR